MGVIPFGALPILKARKRGHRPARMVIVSMVGALPNDSHPIVIADRRIEYRWDWIRDLQACFWTHPEGYIAKHILDASKARPAAMYLWDCANLKGYDVRALPAVETISRPKEEWVWRVEADRWLPFQEQEFLRGEPVWS